MPEVSPVVPEGTQPPVSDAAWANLESQTYVTAEAPREGTTTIKTVPGPTPGAEADPFGDPGMVQPGMSTEEILASGARVVVPFELPPTGEGMQYDDGPEGTVPPDLFARGNAAFSRGLQGDDDSAAGPGAQDEA